MKDHNDSISVEKAMQFLKTLAGQQLLGLLKNSKDQSLLRAKELIAKGDINGAAKALQGMTNTSQIQNLLQKQEGK